MTAPTDEPAMPNSKKQGDPSAQGLTPTFRWQSVAFAAKFFGFMVFAVPAQGILPGIYAKYYGFSLTELAGVLMLVKVFDAINDPLIGWLSDRHKERTGSRKLFVAVGGLLSVPCVWFLYIPPEGFGPVYFLFWYVLLYLANTVFALPTRAWINEFAVTTQEKAFVSMADTIGAKAGTFLFYSLPFLPFFTTTNITPEVLKLTAFVGAALFLPSLYISLRYVPDQSPRYGAYAPAKPAQARVPFFQQLRRGLEVYTTNRPFLLYAVGSLCYTLAAGMFGGLMFIFIDGYLGLGGHYASGAMVSSILVIVITPLLYGLVTKIGVKRMLLIGLGGMTVLYAMIGFVTPELAAPWIIYLIFIWAAFFGGPFVFCMPLLLYNAIDYGRLKDQTERTAQYTAVYVMITKVEGALGGALGFAVAGWFGFDVAAEHHSDLSVMGFYLAISWFPVLLMIIGFLVLARMPLTEHNMTTIRKRLTTRMHRAARMQS